MFEKDTFEGKHVGPERRREQRRKITDRREMLRFEPDKEDRRSGKDRRGDTGWDTNSIE